MANKYIIEGATYNGDGTTSSEAASAGAAGAWNHADIIIGAALGYGSLSAGDTVYIRSKTAAGADITITYSAAKTLGSASATAGSWITWVLDSGDVWSGIDGVLTLTQTANFTTTVANYNHVCAKTKGNLIYKATGVMSNGFALGMSIIENMLIDHRSVTQYGGNIATGTTGRAEARNCIFKQKWFYYGFITSNNFVSLLLVNPDIEITDTTVVGVPGIFNGGGYGGKITVQGGKIYGSGLSNKYLTSSATTGAIKLIGTVFPVTLPIASAYTAASGVEGDLEFIGANSDQGSGYMGAWGYADSRQDGNYPYLNATFLDSGSTGWSWKVYPVNTSTNVASEVIISSLFTGTAASKTIDVQLAVANGFVSSFDTRNTYIDVFYVDNTTGLQVMETSRAAASGTGLTASSSTWSPTDPPVYGAISLTKKQITLTTAGSVKTNTPVLIRAVSGVKSATVNDIWFIDPAVGIT